jgi:long-chain acyl-CoA synthetase
VIVTGAGMNVHPADLEAAIMKLPGIRGCVVVSCETTSGPEPVAVVLFSGRDEELHSMIGEANRELAEYQQIRRVLRWPDPQFPYNSMGKLLRRKVAEWACAVLLSRQQGKSSGAVPGGDVLLTMIAEITDVSLSGVNDQLRLSEDLHLDSLGRVQLQSALEQRLGLELEDDAISEVETLGDLRALLDWKEETGLSSQVAGTAEEAGAAPVIPANVPATESLPKERGASEYVFPRWPWSSPIHVVRLVFLELVMRPLIWLLAAPRIVRETSDLPLGPILVITNHVTAYDGALVLYALPRRLRRRIAIAMSGELLMDLRKGRNQQSKLRNLLAPTGYWLVTALFNVFPLPRLRGFRKSFAHAGEMMDRGYSVLIFPEGARSPDGLLHPFRPGIGLLALQSRVPVVPVALIGLGEMCRRKTRWFRSGQLEVRVGEAVAVDEAAEPMQLAAKLEESVRRLLSKG